jgi:hypothetical protein
MSLDMATMEDYMDDVDNDGMYYGSAALDFPPPSPHAAATSAV